MNVTAESRDGQPPSETVRDVIRRYSDRLSRAERRVARALLAAYPIAGLETVAKLAERAGVSGPTVVRFTNKVGFDGYADFQAALHREVQDRLSSPLVLYERRPAGTQDEAILDSSREAFTAAVSTTLENIPPAEFHAVLELLSDRRRNILCAGGRFSQILASYLTIHLNMLRPRARFVGGGLTSTVDELIDIGRRDVFVVFDYRRYQTDSIVAARRAHEQGAQIVLFTDPWLSPIAEVAHHVLPARVEAPSPFDSLVPAMALVETVIAGLAVRIGDDVRSRISRLEHLREGVTWNDSPALASESKDSS
jgi:DNA-binding MurR/RpiR family transcriptional regulator